MGTHTRSVSMASSSVYMDAAAMNPAHADGIEITINDNGSGIGSGNGSNGYNGRACVTSDGCEASDSLSKEADIHNTAGVAVEMEDDEFDPKSGDDHEAGQNPTCCCGDPCCSGDPCCVLCFKTRFQCLMFCLLPTLLIIGAIVFVFWPRCILVNASQESFKIQNFTYTPVPFAFGFGAELEGYVSSANYWGLTVDSVNIDAKYRGVTMATGVVNDLDVSPRATKYFKVDIQAACDSACSINFAANYPADCAVVTGTWRLDLNVEVKVLL